MKHSSRNHIKLIAFLLILLTFLGTPPSVSLTADAVKLDYYTDVRGKDLSGLNLKDKEELLFTLTFDNLTKWPDKDRLPGSFDPVKLLKQGKEPGLGIRKLQKEGYTGKGVSIAYIDQHILPDHDAYTNVDLHNYEIQTGNVQASMHGPAVLSLLAGREIGIVPDAEVYFFGHNGQKDDNEYEAKAFEKIIEINKALPDGKKIRVVGMSHAADDTLDKVYAEHLRKAQEAARKSGIIVVDVNCGMATCGAPAFKNREDWQSYRISNWEKGGNFNNSLFVPADNRTTGSGYLNDRSQYIYWGEGGFSWGVPYITGVITMGLQIDPGLTEQKAFEYLRQSWHPFTNGGIINPEGFLKLVRSNCTTPRDISLDKNYRYFLYNSGCISEKDKSAISEYTGKFTDGYVNVMLDVAGCSTANEVYSLLKKESSGRNGSLVGIQIFGTSKDVPAFDINYKIHMKTGIDEGGIFKSDFFYSNFKSDENSLISGFSIYKAFKDKLKVSFIPEWSVARLPLSKDEIAPFINRCFEYADKVSERPFGSIVNFSSPIFATAKHTDDMSYFMKERLEKEFKILGPGDYRLFGNKQGAYPLETHVLGDFSKENIAKENKAGIKEFVINSHGQWNNIDQCIFTTKEANSEKRISFLNNSDINTVLSANYYDLDTWTCLNAYNLDDKNLIHEAMANGKCISAMAASSVLSNNGVDNMASYQDLKKNNFYYFYMNYFYYLALGRNRSESFTLARKSYAEEVMKNTDLIESGNYQFNLHNILAYHYLGLLEYWKVNGKSNFKPSLPLGGIVENKPVVKANDGITGKTNGNITFNNAILSKDLEISSFRAIKSGKDIKLLLVYNYTNSSPRGYCLFNPPDGDLIKILKVKNGITKGKNTITFTIPLAVINKAKELTISFSKINNDFSNWDDSISFRTDQFGDCSGLPDK